MSNLIKPPREIWTPGLVLRRFTEKLYKRAHGYRAPNYMMMGGKLWARHFREGQLLDDLGLVSVNLVTTVFVNDVVDNLIAEVAAFGDYKYHISGTNTVAESVADDETDITGATPVPATGTQIEGATAEIYKTVATIAYTSVLAITAHGIINNSTKAGSILMDHSQFTAINVVNLDSIEFTYELTVNDGG